MRQCDHLIVGRALLLVREQLSVIGDQPAALIAQPPDLALQRLACAHAAHVPRKSGEGHAEVVIPTAVIVIEPIADIDVEPGFARNIQFLEPTATRFARRTQRLQDVLHGRSFPELRIDFELDRTTREPPQLIVGPKYFRIDSRDHPRDGLVGDFWKRLFAEIEKCQVRAIPQQQKLEVVVPHPEVAFERLLVGYQEVVVRGDAAARVHVFERLEFRQCRGRQGLGVLDQLQHLSLPLLVQRFPVLVVIERALLELCGAARDFRGIGNAVSANVYPAIDDSVIDAQCGRQTMHPSVGRTQRAISRLCGHHVECRHGLGKVHRIVEPEFMVVVFRELNVIGIGRLGPFGTRYDLHRARQRELTELEAGRSSFTPDPNGCRHVRS